VLVVAHLKPRPAAYDPLRDAISDYGAGEYHMLYRAQVLLMGAGAALLAVALHRYTHVGGTVGWLWVFAVTRALIAFFMTDIPGDPATRDGRIHLLLAGAAFTAIGFGAPIIGNDLASEPGWGEAPHVLGWTVAATAVATLLSRPLLPRWFGLIERALYAAYVAWLLLVAIELVTVT
jgi:hypothetical protein